MENLTYGLHHITAIAGDAQRTYDFYTKVLGLRLVKKTVNFDAPDAYHFYFGDTAGSPGTILTFFAWGDEVKGIPGAGTVSQITFDIPVGSTDFWKKRLTQNNIRFVEQKDGFEENILSFADPDGLSLALIETEKGKTSQPWITSEIAAQYATQGFYGITLTLNETEPSVEVLKELLGYTVSSKQGAFTRLSHQFEANAAYIDILELPDEPEAFIAAGIVHHVAFRTPTDEFIELQRAKVLDADLHVSPIMDRTYFHSIYFREPGGVLFEVATDSPGFDVDEPLAELGQSLKLPIQFERFRSEIENTLTPIY